MSQEASILTAKDLTILQIMLDRSLGRDDPMALLLRRKIDSAEIVRREDVPAAVATLNSRVLFRVDGREPDTRVIAHDAMRAPVGLFLPLASPRGLALLGLAEGEAFRLPRQDGAEEVVMLEKVLYQPESSWREKKALARVQPALRLIKGGARYDERPAPRLVSGGFDDPGPSAA